MSTAREIVAELRTLGYTGPVSYGKPKLEALLQATKGMAELRPTVQAIIDATPASAEQHREAQPPVGLDIDQAGWCGLLPGALVRIADGPPGWTFRFVSYESPASGKPYVVVSAHRRRQMKQRYFAPERILDNKTKKPMLETQEVSA
jgi:hypothetical protein